MTLGPRILKTGFAVILALYICSALELEPAIFAGVAAILAVQPSIYRTWKQMLDQFITNTLGAAVALFFIHFLGDNPITIGLVIMLVISLSLKLKMESTIPLTLVTVLAIMSAPGNEDLLFTLNRFLIILIGTSSAMLVNVVILPPKYKKTYTENVQSSFQNLSILLRTAISNELSEKSFQEQSKALRKSIEKLEEQYKLFDEEREKIGKINKTNAREVVVFKQMLKALQEGEHLLENIEEHYFQSKTTEEENQLFDEHLEQLIKCHEFLLLKYQGKMKEHEYGVNDVLAQSGTFFERVLEIYNQNKEQKLRLMITTSSIIDYTFHLNRLNKLIDQFLKQK
ncbi:aromatic acid exporter family protein [Alkalihalobacillus sp. BA299]|uniref:FUSC family protein n=1 Tax=Alkalihalobacillus sp. BA299 TaxID=2815938 RepID=UPI001AD96B1B|nr:aromatic acid exporter family protein [Alkalihalobacillus sp. BA299]